MNPDDPDGRNAVDLTSSGTGGKIHPYRQLRLGEPRVACRRAEVEHLLARRGDVGADYVRKKMRQPGATREHEDVCVEPCAIDEGDAGQRRRFCDDWFDDRGLPIRTAFRNEMVDDVLARAPGEEIAGVWLDEDRPDAIEADSPISR